MPDELKLLVARAVTSHRHHLAALCLAIVIAGLVSVYVMGYSSGIFYYIFMSIYSQSEWMLIAFYGVGLSSLVASLAFLIRNRKSARETESPIGNVSVSGPSNLTLGTIGMALVLLFAIPYLEVRQAISVPGGDAVLYVFEMNQFFHSGPIWILMNDSRPFVDTSLAIIYAVFVPLFGVGQRSYVVSTSGLQIISTAVMVGSSMLFLRRNGFGAFTIFVALLLTLSSTEILQMSGDNYAAYLATSLFYLSVLFLDKVLGQTRASLLQPLLFASSMSLIALSHTQLFAVFCTVSASIVTLTTIRSGRRDIAHLGNTIKLPILQLAFLGPFIFLALFNAHYFGVFSPFLGDVRGKYFSVFPTVSRTPFPPQEFDRQALLALIDQYGNVFLYGALILAFLAMTLKFKRGLSKNIELYALGWSVVVILGAAISYVYAAVLGGSDFPGFLYARRLIYVLPLPFLYATLVERFRN